MYIKCSKTYNNSIKAILIFTRKDTDDKTNNYRAKVFSGLKYIRQNRFLKYYFWSCICYSFVSPALIILLPKLADKLGSTGLYSTLYLCFVGGFLLGTLISGKLTPTVKTISYTWMLSTIPLLKIGRASCRERV